MKTKSSKGFTLVELMITIGILGVLLTIAVPNYSQYLISNRRVDARHLLLLNAQRLQRCFTLEGVYNGACVTRDSSTDGYYILESDIEERAFSLTARPIVGKSQDRDTACTTLSYDHTGKKGATGSDPSRCW